MDLKLIISAQEPLTARSVWLISYTMRTHTSYYRHRAYSPDHHQWCPPCAHSAPTLPALPALPALPVAWGSAHPPSSVCKDAGVGILRSDCCMCCVCLTAVCAMCAQGASRACDLTMRSHWCMHPPALPVAAISPCDLLGQLCLLLRSHHAISLASFACCCDLTMIRALACSQ
jgi:hypothetical protein